MKKKRVLLIGAGLVFSCVACCCGGYLWIPPTDIVGLYDDEPVTVAGSWDEQWEFKDSGLGTVTMKTNAQDKMAVVHFKYRYARQFPAFRMAWYTPVIAAHSLEISECTGEAGARPPRGLAMPQRLNADGLTPLTPPEDADRPPKGLGMPQKLNEPAPALVQSRRFKVSVLSGNVILEPEDPSIPAVVLKRR